MTSNKPNAAKVLIVQPYVPRYRVPLFHALASAIEMDGLSLSVVAPRPSGTLAARADEGMEAPWLTTTSSRSVTARGVSVTYLGALRAMRSAAGVIVPAAASCLDTHLAVRGPGRTRRRVALWGHLDAFVKEANRLDLALERSLLQRADHVFAYTQRGADFACGQGVQARKLTVLNNTIDSGELKAEITAVTSRDQAEFREIHGLRAQRIFGYIGALDGDKRVDFLVSALDYLNSQRTDVQVVVAGRGSNEGLLQPAIDRGQVVWIGHATPRQKALIASISVALLNPGRIGLIAVDALTMNIPIITSGFDHHAPEYEYLVPGQSVFVNYGDAEHFGAFVERFQPPDLDQWTPPPTLPDMVSNFRAGILAMMA